MFVSLFTKRNNGALLPGRYNAIEKKQIQCAISHSLFYVL